MPVGSSPQSAFRPWLSLSVVVIVAILYFAREFLVPLALAVLISFLLAPLTRRLERWHLGRVGAVVLSTALAFLAIGVVGYVVAGQVIDLAERLPSYKSNLRDKIVALKTNPQSPLGRATQTLRDLTDEMSKPDAVPGEGPAQLPPVPVAVVAKGGNSFEAIARMLAPFLAPLGTAAIVVVFVIFMLLQREDLRDRMIHLVGRGRLQVTTQAIDDAGRRVSRYLLAQLIVNVTYGIPIGLGLYLIGVPNAILWGFLGTVLRFVPYLGPAIAASFPLALSLAVSPSWKVPLLVAALFVVVEIVSNNVVEPLLYGSSTGLSPIAIIVSAVFWTWLWETPGLLLATPLTVCIAVIGKHIPSLGFLDVLLGDRPPIAKEQRFYQRLLAADPEEAVQFAEQHVTEHGLASSFDSLLTPAVVQAEQDFRDGTLDENNRHDLYMELRDLIATLGESPALPEQNARVLCIPASNEFDEVGALMLVRLLGAAGLPARVLSAKLMSGEVVEATAAADPKLICLSVLSVRSLLPAAQLCARLRARLPDAVVTVGSWGATEDASAPRLQRLRRSQADLVFFTLSQAAAEIVAHPQIAVSPFPPRPEAA